MNTATGFNLVGQFTARFARRISNIKCIKSVSQKVRVKAISPAPSVLQESLSEVNVCSSYDETLQQSGVVPPLTGPFLHLVLVYLIILFKKNNTLQNKNE